MLSVDKVYQFVNFIANKEQGVSYLSPDQYNLSARYGFLEFIQDKYRVFESTQNITDMLDDIKAQTFISSTTNTFSMPDDYMHFDAAYYAYKYVSNGEQNTKYADIAVMSSAQVNWRRQSEFEQPTELFPVAYFVDNQMVVLPKTITSITLNYIRTPLIPFWNYVITSGEPVYAATGGVDTNPNSGVTAGNSTDFECPEYCLVELSGYILKYLGISIKDADIASSYQAFLKNE